MKKLSAKTIAFFLHLGLFVVVEMVFVFLLFREFPETNLLTLIGVLHTSYRLILLVAWWMREKRATKVRHKFLATYLPIVYHVGIHIYAGIFAVQEHANQFYQEHEFVRIIIW